MARFTVSPLDMMNPPKDWQADVRKFAQSVQIYSATKYSMSVEMHTADGVAMSRAFLGKLSVVRSYGANRGYRGYKGFRR